MPTTLYHVTPETTLDSIAQSGLLLQPSRRHFDTGQGIYLSASITEAYRWAGEIARQRAAVTQMALLSIDVTAAEISTWANSATEITKTSEVVIDKDIPAHAVQVLETFSARPMRSRKREQEFAAPVFA